MLPGKQRAPVLIVEDDPYDANPLHRGFLWLMNTRDYAIEHAEAIGLADVDFDSCANEAVISGQVGLGAYDTVVWICGEESTADETFSATEQSLVQTFPGDFDYFERVNIKAPTRSSFVACNDRRPQSEVLNRSQTAAFILTGSGPRGMFGRFRRAPAG